MISTRLLVPALAAVLGLATVTARADVDVEVAANAKVKGTLAPEGELEAIRFEAARGTQLSLSVAAKKGGVSDLDVRLIGPGENPADLDGFGGFTNTGTKAKLKKFILNSTGTWRLELEGAGTGEYSLKLKTKPAKSFKETLDSIGPSSSASYNFAIPVGSTLKMKAKPTKGSTAEPRFGVLQDGEFDLSSDLTEEGKFSTKSHSVTVDDTGFGGEMQLNVHNRGTTTGSIDVQIKVKAPKIKAAKLDLRGSVYGSAGGGETVVSRNISADDGGTVAVENEESPIAGATVQVPEGALDEDTTITVTSITSPPAPGEGENQLAGPAIDLQPSGLMFNEPVTVTVPYDPDSLPVGADPETDLRILLLEDDGSFLELTPVSVDTINRVAQVLVSGFSTCVAYVPAGSPQLNGRDYWVSVFEMSMDQEFEGDDSRHRPVFIEQGMVSVTGSSEIFGWMNFQMQSRMMDIFHDDNGFGIVSRFDESNEGEQANWSYNDGGQSIEIDWGEDDAVDLFVGADGDLILGGVEEGLFPAIFQDLYIEKSSTAPTVAEMAGTYHWCHLGVFAEVPEPQGAVNIEFFRGFGTLTLTADGKFTLKVDENFNSTFDGMSKESYTDKGTFRIAGEGDGIFAGSVILETGGNDPISFRLLPSADRNVMVGTDKDDPGQEFLYALVTRKGSGMAPSDVNGPFGNVDVELELANSVHPITGGNMPDVELANVRGLLDFDGTSTFELEVTREVFMFWDPNVPGGVNVQSEGGFQEMQSYSLGSDGKVSYSVIEDDGKETFVGAMSPDTNFLMVVDDPKSSIDAYALFLSIRLPNIQEN
ncbi:MAG: hypothetical protein ACYTDX_03205 [Planctomycetota bacterium]|jgi:hypothetical protein